MSDWYQLLAVQFREEHCVSVPRSKAKIIVTITPEAAARTAIRTLRELGWKEPEQ